MFFYANSPNTEPSVTPARVGSALEPRGSHSWRSALDLGLGSWARRDSGLGPSIGRRRPTCVNMARCTSTGAPGTTACLRFADAAVLTIVPVTHVIVIERDAQRFISTPLCAVCAGCSQMLLALFLRARLLRNLRGSLTGQHPGRFVLHLSFRIMNNSATGVMRRRLQAHCLFLIFSVIGWHQWHDALKLFLRQINPTEVEDTCAKGRLAVFFSFQWEDASTSRTGRSSTE